MKQTLPFLFLSLLSIGASAGEPIPDQEAIARAEFPTELLYRLWQDQTRDTSAIDRFYEALPDKHVIEPSKSNPKRVTVTYFAKGSAGTDFIMQAGGPDLYGLRFKRFGSSDVFFCVQEIPADAWFKYGVNEFKRTVSAKTGGVAQHTVEPLREGTIIGPDAPLSPHVQMRDDVPKGKVQEFLLINTYMGDERKISVYTPAAHRRDVAHNLVLQFDGQNYARDPGHGADGAAWTPMPTIMDNLIHEQLIGPTIVLFVHNKNRSADLLNEKFADFVALELVAWARENYNISPRAADVIASGPSRAGFAAANAALRHASIIGGVLSQSGSFYYTLQPEDNWPIYPEFEGKLVQDYKRAEKRDIRFYLDVGLYDLGLGAVGTNRQLRDILELKGYTVDYFQYKGGHSHLGWRHTLPKGLISLLGNTQGTL